MDWSWRPLRTQEDYLDARATLRRWLGESSAPLDETRRGEIALLVELLERFEESRVEVVRSRDIIHAQMLRLGVSVTELARLLDLPHQHVSAVSRGKRALPKNMARRLLENGADPKSVLLALLSTQR